MPLAKHDQPLKIIFVKQVANLMVVSERGVCLLSRSRPLEGSQTRRWIPNLMQTMQSVTCAALYDREVEKQTIT